MLSIVYKHRALIFTLMVFPYVLLLLLSIFSITAAAQSDSTLDDTSIVGQLDEILRCGEGSTLEEYIDSTTGQFSLGSATADAMRHLTDTDIAIYNGGELYQNILSGSVTWETIKTAFTVQRQIGVASITPKDLYEILEYGFCYIELNESEWIDRSKKLLDGFPQVSGLSVKYDVSALPFERIIKITLSDGRTLDKADDETIITLTATAYMLEGGYGYPAFEYTALKSTQTEALAGYISTGIPFLYADESEYRQKTIGSDDSRLFATATGRFVLLASTAGLAVIISISTWRKYANRKELDNYIDSHMDGDV